MKVYTTVADRRHESRLGSPLLVNLNTHCHALNSTYTLYMERVYIHVRTGVHLTVKDGIILFPVDSPSL